MCYAYAAIAEDAPFVMGAPNLCVDTPATVSYTHLDVYKRQPGCSAFKNSSGTDKLQPGYFSVGGAFQ